MVLTKNESREWNSLLRKSKAHRIPIKRTGPANVVFSRGVHAQLGTGRATLIMDAKIKLRKAKVKRI